jgi:hypothetical protein
VAIEFEIFHSLIVARVIVHTPFVEVPDLSHYYAASFIKPHWFSGLFWRQRGGFLQER